MNSKTTIQKIEEILKNKFSPIFLNIKDDSAKHAGHVGARSGKGHYQVEITSTLFQGKSLIEQHRMVNDALRELLQTEIHALQLKTRSS